MSQKVQLQVGIQDNLREITVTIPDNAPRPWDGTDQLQFIGKRIARVDGKAKATGSARYSFDVQLPGMLYAKFLCSPYPAAVVTSVDFSQAAGYPGVRAILLVREKLPIVVRFVGQEILALAAETPWQAEEALRLIRVEYERRAFVVDVEESRKPSSPEVFSTKIDAVHGHSETQGDVEEAKANLAAQKGNVRGPKVTSKGGTRAEIEDTLAHSDVVVEATYHTQVQTHSALEPHGLVAKWDKDELTVWVSTQSIFTVRDELATVFKLPKSQVRVVTEYMGGGFGAKFGAELYGVMAARLARQTNAPVRLFLSRKEEHLLGGNRPSSVQKLTIGADKGGKLTAVHLLSYGTAGVGTGAGTAGPVRAIYACPKVYTEESDVFINASPGTYFRAPGHPQGAFALEQTVDELAYRLHMDPLELRKINTADNEIRQLEYTIGEEKFGWGKRNPKPGASQGPIKRGMGVANSVWYYFYGRGYQATLHVYGDGSVELLSGVQDIGGGIGTALAAVVAEELGISPSEIKVRIGDTGFGYGPPSGGSQTTGGISPAVRNAAFAAKQKVFALAAPLLKTSPEKLSVHEGHIFVPDESVKSITWKQAAAQIQGDRLTVIGERGEDHREVSPRTIGGVQFAEIEVDTETGVIQVKRVVAVHDCGRPLNRLALESQIQGGIIQGISYALFEERILDRNTGVMVNPNFETYKIAGAMDVPEIETVVLDVNHGQSSTGAMGIGEPPTIPPAAAIANAFYHATKVRIRELPMTPEKVLAAVK